MAHRDTLLTMAKLAEQAERFQDMAKDMKAVVEIGTELSEEENNLLSVAYKNLLGTRRTSWRAIARIENKTVGTEKELKIIKDYRETIGRELKSICDEVLALLNENLIPRAKSAEPKVFYLKMKGDYYRYLAEVALEKDKKSVAEISHQAYGDALEMCKAELITTNPLRLGLCLNFSVFYFETLGDSVKACQLAKEAFDGAVADLDTLSEENYKDSTLIMQLLKDNLTVWSTHTEPQPQQYKDTLDTVS